MPDFDNFDELEELDNDINRPQPFTIEKTIEALRASDDDSGILPAGAVYGLSDLNGAALQSFEAVWATLSLEKRRHTVEFLVEVGEYNFDLNLEPLAYVLLEDDDAEVRANAIELTWYATNEKLFHTLVKLADDEAAVVRAAAMVALGRFIYEAELDEFDKALGKKAQKLALDRYDDLDEDLEVRRRSLEAVSRSSHPRIPELIEEAYQHSDVLMQASAVFAMGASLDRRWAETVEIELDSHVPEVRFEATRAAGELSLTDTVPQLIALANEEDYEVKLMAIWALGEIGTMEARRGLEDLAEQAEELEDETLIEAVEEALEISQLVGGSLIPMFDFDEETDIDDDLDFDDDYYEDDDDYLPPSMN